MTNPLGQGTSQTLDPTRNLALTVTDVNGVVTTSQYDALGRVTSVWLDSRATTAVANLTYAYTVSAGSLSGVVAQKMGDNLSYAATVTILDALGRTREVQTGTPQGGRLITDQFYDSRGWVWKKNNNYWDSSTSPALSLDSVADGQVPNQDEYTFDGLGRTVADISRNAAKTVLLSGAGDADVWCGFRHAVCRRILVCAVAGGRVRWRRHRADEGIRRPSRYLSGRGVPGGPCRARRRCAHGRGRCCPGRGPACQRRAGVPGLRGAAGAVGVGPGAGAAG